MKIQIDQNGMIQQTDRAKTTASGLTVMRHRHKITIEIGTRATAHALLGTLNHIRSMQADVFMSCKKQTYASFISSQKLSIAQACLILGQIALSVIERKYEHLKTNKIDFLTQHDISKCPSTLHCLTDLRLIGLDTSTALTRLEERDMAQTTFIIPTSESHFKIHKLPLFHLWPTACPYLPLPLEEIIPSPFCLWYSALYQISLSVKRPLIHHCEMLISLHQSQSPEGDVTSPDILNFEEISPHFSPPQWYSLMRILYPLAAETEKPINFRLLTVAATLKDNHILL